MRLQMLSDDDDDDVDDDNDVDHDVNKDNSTMELGACTTHCCCCCYGFAMLCAIGVRI